MLSLNDFLAATESLVADAHVAVAAADSADALTAARNSLVGRNSGRLTALMKQLGQLRPDDRRAAGAAANQAKEAIEAALDARTAAVHAAAHDGPVVDLSMPARHAWRGSRHPVTAIIDEISEIFRELGFTIALGPEVELEHYNFGALNFPPDHPAMDMHDTLYVGNGAGVLRTHTSPVQIRTLQQYPPPIRILAPGPVYRRDFFDATHAPMFAQIEGLAVDEGISFVDLKATLTHFARRIYGTTRRTRFGPSYFPFTEPSAQMDVEMDLGDGKGMRWVEILGCGMVHPNVLDAAGVDSEKYTGWAFGMGPARIAMSRHGITDIRVLYDSDVRFLEQFGS